MIKNAASRTQIKEAGRKQRFSREQELEDVKFILGSLQGRRFVWRYLEECGVFKTSFTGTSQTFFLEGERNVGLRLLADINEAQPEAYVTMMKENKQEINNG